MQRPPALLEGNARAAQKSLPSNAKSDCVGENYESGGEKSARRLGVRRAYECFYHIEMMRPVPIKLIVSTYLLRVSLFNLLQTIAQLIARNP
jgi:hypothetical protein